MTAWQNIPRRKKIYREYSALFPVYDEVMQKIARHMRDAFHREDLNVTFKFRVKSFESYFNKLIRRMQNDQCDDPYNITDIIGFRIICPFMEDMEAAEQIIRNNFTIRSSEQKGLHHTFREFGYEATHLMMDIQAYLPENETHACTSCEVQLSTTLQDAWAEVEHELVYKAGFTPFDIPLKRKLAALNANLTLADIIFQEIRDYHRSLHAELFKRRRQFWNQIQRTSGLPLEHPSEGRPEESEPPDLMDPSRLGIASDTIESQLLRALHAHNQHEFERAVELYSEILDSEITSHLRAIVLIHRGMAFFAMSSYERAVTDFSATLELDDDNWKAYYYRGMVHRLQGAFREALSDLNRCLQLDYGRFDSLFARAQVYFDMGNYQKALSDCDAALELEPESSEARRFRKIIEARLLSEAGNWSG